jgi:heat shock protein HslJ
MQRRWLALVAVLVIVVTAVVGISTRSDPEPEPDLVAVWQLVSIDPVPEGFTVTAEMSLEFTDNGRFQAKDRCNYINGTWEQGGSVVAFSDLSSTAMDCPPPDDDVLRWSRWSEARVDGNGRLVLTHRDQDVVYERASG